MRKSIRLAILPSGRTKEDADPCEGIISISDFVKPSYTQSGYVGIKGHEVTLTGKEPTEKQYQALLGNLGFWKNEGSIVRIAFNDAKTIYAYPNGLDIPPKFAKSATCLNVHASPSGIIDLVKSHYLMAQRPSVSPSDN
jgi:hypothetical protein